MFNISSSNFNVKQNGDVTGSNVLFISGGKVGGWVMTDSTLTGGVVTWYFYWMVMKEYN